MLETCELPYSSKFPGIAHKCGHDGHSATLAAFALEVDQNGADKIFTFFFNMQKKQEMELKNALHL